MKLFIGSKNYSSWSLRPWAALKLLDLPFDEVVVQLAGKGVSINHKPFSPNGLVPCLHDGEIVVFDSLAIIEYLGEKSPGAHALGFIWPQDAKARALARSICAEMHSGFSALRNNCPMNIKLKLEGGPLSEGVAADLARIDAIWTDCLSASGGPFLFGSRMSAADAFYAPVCYRVATHNLAKHMGSASAEYVAAVIGHDVLKEWTAAALSEDASVSRGLAHYDEASLKLGGAVRSTEQ